MITSYYKVIDLELCGSIGDNHQLTMANLNLQAVNHDGVDLFTLAAVSGCEIVGNPLIPDGSIASFRFESPISKVSLPSLDFRSAQVTIH